MPAKSASRHVRRRTPLLLALGAALAGMVVTSLPASGQAAGVPADAVAYTDYGFQGEGEARIHDLDSREGVVQPTDAQQAIARELGATSARWNSYGTPHVLLNDGDYLSAPREGEAADVARAFVADNAELFKLEANEVASLELLNDSPLYDSPDLGRVYRNGNSAANPSPQAAANPDVSHVILFRQRFGDLVAGLDGQLTVGVKADGRVAWVTSSVTGDDVVQGNAQLSESQAIEAAATDVELDLGTLTKVAPDGGFQVFESDLVTDVQRVRDVALPTPTDGVRRAYEVTLLDTSIDEHGNPTAFITLVDAETGKIWQRTNKVEHFAQGVGGASSINLAASAPAMTPAATRAMAPSAGTFGGSTVAGACDPERKPFEVTEGNGTIRVNVTALSLPEVMDDDIVVNLYFGGEQVASQDFLSSPEVLIYQPAGGVEPGTYEVEVCPFNGASAPPIPYEGTFSADPSSGNEDGAVPGGGLPTWDVFPANPPFVADKRPEDFDAEDTRVLWCWDNARKDECVEEQRNDASRVPWDVNPPSMPSFTTDGNNASTAISEFNFRAPDTGNNRPTSPTREYEYPWTDAWFENSCDPTRFGTADATGGPNDESASTANLFVQHNRMHDWSYYLGFTENNFNMQKSNFGNTGSDRENDPEIGSSQAGRRTVNGRDNANQLTLQDGIAPITNQYLWQPLAGAFYAPCVDGAYDQAVVAHEYGHAITNRMIAGPDTGTGPTQGQTESWSDLQFAAYFSEFDISAGEGVNPLVLGPYVTGDLVAGIRNYAMNESPLNYSDLDYDGNGLGSPHANGEIWSAVNFDIFDSFNNTYDAEFPSSDSVLQNRCARGELPADECPGNRRWNQIQYDSYLIQPTGSTMIDSRDAMLAADLLRFDGANQDDLWNAFAKRGLGERASSTGPDDVEAIAGFDSRLREDEATVTFDGPADMEVFVGAFEARATPIADTVADTDEVKIDDVEPFLPGSYDFVAVAPGFGAQRFSQTFEPGETATVDVPLRRNLASAANDATITGDGVNLELLIDDTEETNWASFESEGTASEGKGEGAQVEGRQVTVDLAGDEPVDVREVQVSAALRGPGNTEEDEELPSDPDPGTQSRFSALRSFDILACNDQEDDCSDAESFTEIFASADDAFPGGRPRPRVPDFIVRPFDVTDTMATHLRMVVRDNQCTGGPAFQSEVNPDNDPAFNPDCDTMDETPDRAVLSPPVDQVRAAEFQVFSEVTPVTPTPGSPTTPDESGTPSEPGSPGAPQVRARTITDACPPGEVPANSRQDSRGNFHEPAIDCMVWYEIAEGTSSTMYEPREPVSRGQMASFIARLIEESGGRLDGGNEDAFPDDNGSTHEVNINKLAKAGVIDGKADGSYDHLGTVTRDQMAKFLVEGYEFRSGKTLTSNGNFFPDDTGNTHEANINRSAQAGFTDGRNGNYEPRAIVQRDAMASFLARTLDLLVEEGTTVAKSDRT